jgi:hypothetical protein
MLGLGQLATGNPARGAGAAGGLCRPVGQDGNSIAGLAKDTAGSYPNIRGFDADTRNASLTWTAASIYRGMKLPSYLSRGQRASAYRRK